MAIAGIFRKYDVYRGEKYGTERTLELFETDWEKDVEIVADLAAPGQRKGARGIRVRVR